MFDLLIKGGTVIDGTGSPGYAADVAIDGDSIAAIGRIDGESVRTLDATGRAVTPGFVDLHSHADFNFFVDVGADSKITQGVTLEYVGNCGISFCAPLLGNAKEDIEIRYAWYPGGGETPGWANFGDYLDALENNGSALNVATQVGHGTVRRAVMGMDSHAPDIGQIKTDAGPRRRVARRGGDGIFHRSVDGPRFILAKRRGIFAGPDGSRP